MKLLKEYGTEQAAYIDKGLLETNGINCVVVTGGLSSIYPVPDAGIDSVKLYVAKDSYDEAVNLLAQHS